MTKTSPGVCRNRRITCRPSSSSRGQCVGHRVNSGKNSHKRLPPPPPCPWWTSRLDPLSYVYAFVKKVKSVSKKNSNALVLTLDILFYISCRSAWVRGALLEVRQHPARPAPVALTSSPLTNKTKKNVVIPSRSVCFAIRKRCDDDDLPSPLHSGADRKSVV